MALAFIKRKSDKDTRSERDRCQITLAETIVRGVDELTKIERRGAQAVIDSSYKNSHGRLMERIRSREQHAQALIDLARRYGDQREDLVEAIPNADGHVVYRLHQMPARNEEGKSSLAPQNAAWLSALNHVLKDELHGDFGIPDATPATLDGKVGVLVDGEGLLLDGADRGDALKGPALQRTVLMQWMIGGPGRAGESRDELLEPVDPALTKRLTALDLKKIERRLGIARDYINVRFANNVATAALPGTHAPFIDRQTVPQLLDRLRALKTSLKNQPSQSLNVLLIDACMELLPPAREAPAWRRALSAITKPVRRVARFIAELPERFMRHFRSSRGNRPANAA